MKIYLSASLSRQKELRRYASSLREEGHTITARWLREETAGKSPKLTLRQRAEIDVHDVRVSDCLVRFSDDLSAPTTPSHLATGARMTETGLALAWNIPIIIVGGKQNVFDHLPQVKHVKDFKALLGYLGKAKQRTV